MAVSSLFTGECFSKQANQLNNWSYSSAVTFIFLSNTMSLFSQPGLKMHLHINPDSVFLKVSGQNETLKQSNQSWSCCLFY